LLSGINPNSQHIDINKSKKILLNNPEVNVDIYKNKKIVGGIITPYQMIANNSEKSEKVSENRSPRLGIFISS
jgi:hypothetical protein